MRHPLITWNQCNIFFGTFSISSLQRKSHILASGDIQKLGIQFSEAPHHNQYSRGHLAGWCFIPSVLVHFHISNTTQRKLAWKHLLHVSFCISKKQNLLETSIDYCNYCQMFFDGTTALSRNHVVLHVVCVSHHPNNEECVTSGWQHTGICEKDSQQQAGT